MDVKTLNELKINKLKEIGARTAGEYTEDRTVLVCGGTGCTEGTSKDSSHANRQISGKDFGKGSRKNHGSVRQPRIARRSLQ